MAPYSFPFSFPEDDSSVVRGALELQAPLTNAHNPSEISQYRPGKIHLEGYADLDLVLYHNPATAAFMYLRREPVNPNLMALIGLDAAETAGLEYITLPGQLCMGSERVAVIGHAISDLLSADAIRPVIEQRKQHNLAIFPIAREGLKYQVAEAIQHNFGYFCDEIILDAHHVFDSSVPIYNRKVEMTLFKDKDLDKSQRQNISVAFIADSIASGLVLKETIARVKERFDHIERIEVIAPLATVRGLCRIARSEFNNGVHVRVHVFETLLNALPPDFYYSAHYHDAKMHICPDLDEAYRAWWGQDAAGNWIADTACAGYGWSEVFFSPRKQIEMINGELKARHGLGIADVVRRNLR